MTILDQACEAVRTFRPLTDSKVTALLRKTEAAAASGEFEPFKTSTLFDATAQNYDWMGEEPPRMKELMKGFE